MLRLLVALPFAALVSFGLFSIMALMVDNGHQGKPESSENLRFDIVMVEQESATQRRQRSVPEPPEAPQPPPEAQAANTQTSTTPLNTMTPISALSLDTAINGLSINAPTFADVGSNQQAMPLYRVEPRYPAQALKRGAEGYVIMSFTIDPTGRPIDIAVKEANPRRLFEREAIRALKNWKYQPKVIDGKALDQLNQTVRLEFKLAQ
ncbi:energy transducer TonB [Vibrio sp. 10N.286.49.B3]|uniref:energy transducer TonB n=1 Tax=Vibrio sp. 10N.286.49.B3 TaxID=1880855 RepID=UPI000C846D90|nr:energy transducer TonB [Vibrio sp. 10N.286.49.B3]PMH46118.1 energy transducer TonB [Vibrio sp. 10N.286.49.B3]